MITQYQADKLRELLATKAKARDAVNSAEYLSENHWKSLQEYSIADKAIEDYIVSLVKP